MNGPRQATAEDVAVKRHYPDDGGLKAPVREPGETSTCFGVVLRHFRPDLYPSIVQRVEREDESLITGKVLYDRFWARNKWVNPTLFESQAPAIINMWNEIAEDARAALGMKATHA